MANISLSDVTHLATLSNLSLSKTEVKQLQIDLASIVNYISELQELDTSNVEPTYQVTNLENVWREDNLIDYGVTRETLLASAPAVKDQQIKVPKVL